MEKTKQNYESRIRDLELIIQELFNMLRETAHLDQVIAMSEGPFDRPQLIHQLRLQWERKKTIRKLEGRDMKDRKLGEDEDEDEAKVVQAAKGSIVKAREKHMSGSQFADAEEERVRAHIEVALVKGADHVVSPPYCPLANDSHPRRARHLHAVQLAMLLPSARNPLNASQNLLPRSPHSHPVSSRNCGTRPCRDPFPNPSLISSIAVRSENLA